MNTKYFILTIILFAAELMIATLIDDQIIRPFVGDVLVVILIYCFLRIFLKVAYWKVALGVLFFASMIEIFQYFDYVKLLGVENNRVLSIAMGRTFEWADFAAYFMGFLIIILAERFRSKTTFVKRQ